MSAEPTGTPTGAPRQRDAATAAHHRMAYRFASAQYGDRFLYLHPRRTPGMWISVDGTSLTLCAPDDLTRAALDVLHRAVADTPDDERLRVDVALCYTPAGVAAVLTLAAQLEPFAVRHQRAAYTSTKRWR